MQRSIVDSYGHESVQLTSYIHIRTEHIKHVNSDHIHSQFIFENSTPPRTMRVQKTSFLKYVSREQRTRLLRLLLILVFRSFFKSLPLCSIVPDGCTGDDIKIAWGYKKNKVRPRNKVDTGDNVMRSILIFKIEFLGFDIDTFGKLLLRLP